MERESDAEPPHSKVLWLSTLRPPLVILSILFRPRRGDGQVLAEVAGAFDVSLG